MEAIDKISGSPTASTNSIEPLGAINVQQIFGSIWLNGVEQNTIGTLGLGIGSDLWWNTTT